MKETNKSKVTHIYKKISINPFKSFPIKKVIISLLIIGIVGGCIIGGYNYYYNVPEVKVPKVNDPQNMVIDGRADLYANSGRVYRKIITQSSQNEPGIIVDDIIQDTLAEQRNLDSDTEFSIINNIVNNKIIENHFINTKENPISTFSSDVDTASYVTFRQLVENGYTLNDLQSNSVFRTEEMINYFTYNYTKPEGKNVFGITTEVGYCPWNKESQLLRIGIKAKEINISKRAPLNLVFLVDVSGSMASKEKLPLFKEAFASLLEKLNKNDRISIVTYADGAKVVLNSIKGSNKKGILNKVNSLEATGGTNGGEGLKLAYKLAKKNYNKKSNNRIILSTDGDLNIGMTSTDELKDYISEERNNGIYLSVLGFGNGSYNDEIMETLADNGDGNYSIIDTLSEAQKVLEGEFMGKMYTVAKDVKFQMNFDPKYIESYRLIGYENRMMDTEDFDNDVKDAGDMGSGDELTILYELKTCETNNVNTAETNTNDPSSKTNNISKNTENSAANNSAINSGITLNVRYKEPTSNKSKKLSYNIDRKLADKLSDDYMFICSIVETSMLLNCSRYLDFLEINLHSIQLQLDRINITEDKLEFKGLVNRLYINKVKHEMYQNKY